MSNVFRVQIALGVLSMMIPGVAWLLVLLGVLDPLVASNYSMPALIVCWLVMLATPLVLRYPDRDTALTATVLVWGFVGSFFPLVWDLTWAIVHDLVKGATADDHGLWYWWTYAVADTRFLHADHLMIIVEYWSGILGAAEVVAIVLFVKGNISKAFAIAVPVALMQFYGCTVFFGTQAMAGFADISPDLPSRIKVFGLNGMWVFFPLFSLTCCYRLKRDGVDVRRVIRENLLGKTVEAPEREPVGAAR